MPLPPPYFIDAPDVRGNFDEISLKWPVAKQPHAHVNKTVSQSIPSGAFTTLTWTNRLYDPDLIWNGTTGMVAPRAGVYLAQVNVEWVANGDARRRILGLVSTTEGNLGSVMDYSTAGTDAIMQSLCIPVRCAAGDVTTVSVFQDSGVALGVGPALVFAVAMFRFTYQHSL